MARTLYILDGHYQIFRAFYAPFRDLTSPKGEPTKAVHVFCNMLLSLIREKRPDYLAVVLDSGDENVFRRELDPEYKAHRNPTPEDFHVQEGRIIQILEAVRIPMLRLMGFEADDIAATIAREVEEKHKDLDVYIVSRDKDLDQIITRRVRLYDPVKDEVIGVEELIEKKGYPPELSVEVQTLVGDNTDNVPGVHGIGNKTAAKLINQYKSAKAVLEHADELTPKMRENVLAFAQQLPVTSQLVTLRRDVPLSLDLPASAITTFNYQAALPIYEELGFNSIRARWAELAAAVGVATEEGGKGGGGTVRKNPVGQAGLFERELSADSSGAQGTVYQLVGDAAAFNAFVKELSKQPRFAFDTETTGLRAAQAKLVGLSFSWKAGEAYYIPVRCGGGPCLKEAEVIAALRPILEDPSKLKIGQNAKYDMLVLRTPGVRVCGPLFDTMVASFLLDPDRSSHGLDPLAMDHFGHKMIPISDLIGTGRNQLSMDQLTSPQVCDYAAEDADYTFRLGERFEQRLKDNHAEALFRETEMPLVEVLTEMESNGMAVDLEHLRKLGEEIQKGMEGFIDEIHAAAGRPFNVDSPKQLAEVLFDELKLPVIKKTKTGRSTDADTLETLATRSDHPILPLITRYREMSKLKGTYIDPLPLMVNPRTGRIHASFNQTIAATGRLSSNDPNLQNIPVRTPLGKRIREAFIAGEPGHVLLVCDYSQIELRLLAHFCQDKALMAAFERGEDIHRFVAAQVNGVKLEEVTPTQRNAAKAVNFGIIYGQTAFGLSQGLGISRGDAKAFIDAYFARYPGIRRFIDECVAKAKRLGYAETMLGRRRPVEELRSRNPQRVSFGERIAVNTVVQGSAADLIKSAMVDIHRVLMADRSADAPKYTARMVTQVHDELVFEVLEKSVETEAAMIVEKMKNAIPLKVPVVVDSGWGKNWLSAK